MTESRRRPTHRSLALAAAGALLLALAPHPASAQSTAEARTTDRVCDEEPRADFPDIEGSAHADNVRCLADAGITAGLDSGEYGPRQDVTRGQMATFIARFLEDHRGEELPEGDEDRFDDVPPAYVHSDNINALAEIEVVDGTGTSDGASFAPQAQVTRAQMASFIRRSLSYLDDADARNASTPEEDEDAFGDDDGSPHEDNIDALAAAGIVQGFTGGEYRPGDPVLRDQMASFIMRGYDFAIEAALHDVHETLRVEPSSDQTAQEGDTVEFTATGLDGDATYRITLVDAGLADRNDAGLLTFREGTSPDAPGVRTVDAGPPEARIVSVNGSEVDPDPAHTVGGIEPQGPGLPIPGTAAITFEVEVAGAEPGFVAAVHVDGGASTFLEVNEGGAPVETFGVSGRIGPDAEQGGGPTPPA